MMETAEITHWFAQQWRAARSRTYELLGWMSDGQLLAAPHASLGEIWRQFRHLGRVQCNYMDAVSNGSAQFGRPSLTARGTSKPALLEYLGEVDELQVRTLEAVTDRAEPVTIVWANGESVDLQVHLDRMENHETLHHGQLIAMFSWLEYEFPAGWQAAWGLPYRIGDDR